MQLFGKTNTGFLWGNLQTLLISVAVMMHIFLHHFYGILLLSYKLLILHVKCTTTIVFVSAIFVLFFLRTCKQPDRQERADWSVPALENVPCLLPSWQLVAAKVWGAPSGFLMEWEMSTPKPQQLFVWDLLHIVTWLQEQLRKPS